MLANLRKHFTVSINMSYLNKNVKISTNAQNCT